MAIAYDAGTSPGGSSGTSYSFNHTTTGTDRILFVWNRQGDDKYLNAVTYNGTSMTEVAQVYSGNNSSAGSQTGWILVAPASGTNSVVMTNSPSGGYDPYAMSYTGAKQTGQPDASNTAYTTSAKINSVSVTSVADNCWLTFMSENNVGQNTAGSGTTSRIDTGGHAIMMGDNNSDITPAGSATVSTSWASNGNGSIIGITFAPAPISSPMANGKSWNTLAIA